VLEQRFSGKVGKVTASSHSHNGRVKHALMISTNNCTTMPGNMMSALAMEAKQQQCNKTKNKSRCGIRQIFTNRFS
jgi:hypothetical protein